MEKGVERQVVILMTDMVNYSQKSLGMTPEGIRDFLIDYHHDIHDLLCREESFPVELDPSAGDGCLGIFDKLPGEDSTAVCTRALRAVVRVAEAIAVGRVAPTRMGLLLGRIIEARLGSRMAKFGASFSVANRLEELCGHFGTVFLMDREMARNCQAFEPYLVNIAKVSLASVEHPMNFFTLYLPGLHHCPAEINEEMLQRFIFMKNQAMEYFGGNQLTGTVPNFPRVREELLAAQHLFQELTGKEDVAIERILEYIRETPLPAEDFAVTGMKLMEKKRDSLGERLFHLSKQLLRAMNPDFYHALVVDTSWEQYFKLEWRKKGEDIITIGSVPDGIYYLDSGTAQTVNVRGELLSTIEEGSIFGEMAYFADEQKRTATVTAVTDVVLRKISTENFKKLPVIIEIVRQIALGRHREIISTLGRPEDPAASLP
jgi:CRP-like cAMP-binding protein/class 3 adenylate cyclase